MKRTKTISLLLSFVMLCFVLMPGTTAFGANGEENDGLVVNKTATKNGDGTYTIELEAYAVGASQTSVVTKDVPTDIVLVLDQSGSMADNMGLARFEAYSGQQTENSFYYDQRHNGGSGNLWYRLEDGSYVSVSVQRIPTYSEVNESRDNKWYYDNRNNLCHKSGDAYIKVNVARDPDRPLVFPWEVRKYTYTSGDTGQIAYSEGDDSVPSFGEYGPLYLLGYDDAEYIYTYTDSAGDTIEIGRSNGANTQFESPPLYERTVSTQGGPTKLAALKDALNTFVGQVKTKAMGPDGQIGGGDDINHRIAVVGFASGDRYGGHYYGYNNTEVFVGEDQYTYGNSAQGVYNNAFQNMNTSMGQNNVTASIGALTAEGGTLVDLGMEMANGILSANPVEEGKQRNRVVIVFTDGTPGWSGYDSDVAGKAISQGNTAKNTHGATVYTVGIFGGADATSGGSQNGDDAEKANWFMQNLSSNNGTPQTPSYYLSAADSETLTNIFKQISDQIQEGGTTVTLDENAVVRDTIAPSFMLLDDETTENITLETYKYTAESTWEKNDNAMGATASINAETGEICVTGFDFAENWCGTETAGDTTTYRGNKLVIRFEVDPKSGFLGGNGVPTNTGAGVYESSTATDPFKEFPIPDVDVDIPEINVTATNYNVYLLGDLTADQLCKGVTVKAGTTEIALDPAVENYGLEPWQNEYVDIEVLYTYTDENGNDVEVTSFEDLTDDTTYTAKVTIKPKVHEEDGVVPQTGSAETKVNVFKPEITYKDGAFWYGGKVLTDAELDVLRTGTVWKHGETSSTDDGITMIDDAPDLTFVYVYVDSDVVSDGAYNTKQDIGVKVTAKIDTNDITDYTTFVHTDCTGKTCKLPEGAVFLLHPNTCDLTITKSGGYAGEPYVFTILKDNDKYTEASITSNGSVTIYKLPVGTYTIAEDTGWSWRYTPSYSAEEVTLSKDTPSGSITCTNEKTKDYWLNGFSDVVPNVCDVANK